MPLITPKELQDLYDKINKLEHQNFIFTDCEWHGKEKSEIILTAVDPVTNEFYESRIQSLYLDWKKVED